MAVGAIVCLQLPEVLQHVANFKFRTGTARFDGCELLPPTSVIVWVSQESCFLVNLLHVPSTPNVTVMRPAIAVLRLDCQAWAGREVHVDLLSCDTNS